MGQRTTKSDAELMRQARRDPDAFASIYDRHARNVHAWLTKQVGDPVAWELTAETFAQAWIGRKRFRTDDPAGSAGPWLFGIARNLHRRWARTQRVELSAAQRLRIRATPLTDSSESDAIDRIYAASLGPDLAASLDRLPPDQKLAIELRVIQEWSYDAIARHLDCTPDVVRMRVMRGLRTLDTDLRRQLS